MTSKQRLLAAIERQVPDRLPVTTHHVMPYFLNKYMPGTSIEEYFDFFGFDRILWLAPTIPDSEKGEYFDPLQDDFGLIHSRRIVTDRWRIEWRDVPDHEYKTRRYDFGPPRVSEIRALSGDTSVPSIFSVSPAAGRMPHALWELNV